MRFINIIISLLSSAALVLANVEKVVFLGPRQSAICRNQFDIHLLGHTVLSPSRSSVRQYLTATFPSQSTLWRGSESWVILDALEEGKRYEVRICWIATVCRSGLLSC